MPAVLSASELMLSFGAHQVLNGATLAIDERDRIGLVGRNGSGKTSLLRILAGGENPDSGSISRRTGLVTGYLPQEFTLREDGTVGENVRDGAAEVDAMIAQYESGAVRGDQEQELLRRIEARGGWDTDARVRQVISELACPPADRLVRHLSGGEKRRVALARALVSQPDLLLLDEPTNHLDTGSIEWLEEHLRSMRAAVLFVTHDRYFLDRIATRIVELDGGRLWNHEGNYTSYLTAKAERQAADAAREGRRQAFLRREIEWVRAGVKARTTKSRSRLDNYYRIAGEQAPETEQDVELLIPPPPELGNVIVEAEDIGAEAGGRPLFSGLNLSFEAGTCTGIAGRNGLGKSTLLRILMGEIPPAGGTVTIGRKVVFNYVDQQRLALDGTRSALQEVGGGSDFVSWGGRPLHVRSYLKRFLFGDDRVTQRIDSLSGGERSRLLLAKILVRGGNFLVLDEPTNDLDLATLRVLEEALLSFPGCVLVVSHDRWFLDRICDRMVVFEGDGRIHVQPGNYSYYLEKNRERLARERRRTAPARPQASPPKRRRDAGPRKLTWREERELEGMESAILDAEAGIADIEARLQDPAFYAGGNAAAAQDLARTLDEKRRHVQQLYDRWAELEAIRSAQQGGSPP